MPMRISEPKNALASYRGKDSDWDDLLGVPIRRFKTMEQLEFDASSPARYIVQDDNSSLPIDLLFYPRDSDRLLVGFHGAEDRKFADFPKFQFVRSFLTRKESLLFISDSTLLQGEKINIGWCAGNARTPLATLLSRAVRKAGSTLGVRQTVLAGHSAGGFSAVLVGSRVPNSRAISVNGQSIVSRYEPWAVKNLLTEAFPECSSIEEMMSRYSKRLDLRAALRDRLNSSSFTYFGNAGDKSTFGEMNHYPLLAKSLGVEEKYGRTRRGDSFVLGSWGTPEDGGHALPGTILPFIELVLGEDPSKEILHTGEPAWDWDPDMAEIYSEHYEDFDQYTEDDLLDIGMHRCACGSAVYPNGDPDWKHCALDK